MMMEVQVKLVRVNRQEEVEAGVGEDPEEEGGLVIKRCMKCLNEDQVVYTFQELIFLLLT